MVCPVTQAQRANEGSTARKVQEKYGVRSPRKEVPQKQEKQHKVRGIGTELEESNGRDMRDRWKDIRGKRDMRYGGRGAA